jgi:hypothetical protein
MKSPAPPPRDADRFAGRPPILLSLPYHHPVCLDDKLPDMPRVIGWGEKTTGDQD